jgi:hypothetical protein
MAMSNAERQRRFVQRLKAGTVTNERIRELEAQVAKLKAENKRLRHKPHSRDQLPKRYRTPQKQWEFSLNNFALDAVAMRDYWDKLFGDAWWKFKVTPDMAAIAQEARKEWIEVAVNLKMRAFPDEEAKAADFWNMRQSRALTIEVEAEAETETEE